MLYPTLKLNESHLDCGSMPWDEASQATAFRYMAEVGPFTQGCNAEAPRKKILLYLFRSAFNNTTASGSHQVSMHTVAAGSS